MNTVWEPVRQFEKAVAAFAGSTYGVAVDTCTWALFLCLKWCKAKEVCLPQKTFLGVAVSAVHAGCEIGFINDPWKGEYRLYPHPIIDSACRFREGMHTPNTFRCVSFNYRKHLPIGRGGMILHDNAEADRWFRRARFMGRGELPLHLDTPEFVGWHCYMEPERAASGLLRFSQMREPYPPDLWFDYPDLSQYEIFR
jgi:dTDP-4-amino-4,6-dideoxygalactose transaminase